MARCDLCKQFDDCAFRSDPDAQCSEFERKPMTNGDKIRSMSDEELAHTLWLTAKGGIIGRRSEEEWLDWLKQEANK